MWENMLGRAVGIDAAIAVPANFNEFQRRATRETGRIGGLNVPRRQRPACCQRAHHHWEHCQHADT